MKKSFRFRIYPGRKQEVVLNRTLDTCRHLYNDALSERKRQAELNRLEKTFDVFPWGKPEWINYYDQANTLSESKTSYQKEVFSQVLQNVLKRAELRELTPVKDCSIESQCSGTLRGFSPEQFTADPL